MKDKYIDLNTSPDLPQSSASYEGGTNGAVAGTNRQALKRGFSDTETDEGTEYTGNPYDRGGALKRPNGWER